jgi:hypothetical protein
LAQVRPLIDGRDVVAEAFVAGSAHGPELLLSSNGPLRAAEQPHEVELAEAECTVACCGALLVTIRQDGGTVVREGWRDANGPDPDLPSFRFDASAYEREVERAEQGHAFRRAGAGAGRCTESL